MIQPTANKSSSPEIGQVWFDPRDLYIKVFDGTEWVKMLADDMEYDDIDIDSIELPIDIKTKLVRML